MEEIVTNPQTSKEIYNSISFYCQSIHKEFESENLSSYLFPFLPVFSDFLLKCREKDRTQQKNSIFITSLHLITKCAKLKKISLLKSNEEYKKFLNNLVSILDGMSYFRGKDFEIETWKELVDIVNNITDVPSVDFWDKSVKKIFLMGVNNNMEKLINSYTKKIKYLRELLTKQTQISSFIMIWWGIISRVILPIFLSYQVNKEEKKSCIFEQCPKQIYIEFYKITSILNFRQHFSINNYAPLETISLVKLLMTSFDLSESQIEMSGWMFDQLIGKGTSSKSEIKAFLDTVSSASSDNFLLIFQFLIQTLVNQQQPDFSILRNFCLDILPNHEDYISKILYIIDEEVSETIPFTSAYLFLYFTYDFKILDQEVWDYYKNKYLSADQEFFTIFCKFISTISVSFYPTVFELSRKDVLNGISTLLVIGERIKGIHDKTTKLSIEQIAMLFDDPEEFSSIVIDESKLQNDFKNLSKIYILPKFKIFEKNWTKTQALEYLKIYLNLFPTDSNFDISINLIVSWNYINNIIPVNFLGNSLETFQVIFEDIIVAMFQTEINYNFIIQMNKLLKIVGIITETNKFLQLWFELMVKALWYSSKNELKLILPCIISSFLQFSSLSSSLIPFISIIIINKKNELEITESELWTFCFSGISICNANYNEKLCFPNNFIEEIRKWEFIDMHFYQINNFFGKELHNLIPILQSILPMNSNGDVPLKYIIPILFNDTYSEKQNEIRQWFDKTIKNDDFEFMNSYSRLFPEFRELNDSELFNTDVFVQYFKQITSIDNLSSFSIIFNSYFDLYKDNPIYLAQLFKITKELLPDIKEEFKPIVYELIESIPFSFYDEPDFSNCSSDIDTVLLLPNRIVNTFKFYEPNSFCFQSRNPNYLYQANITPIKSKYLSTSVKKENIRLPKVSIKSNETLNKQKKSNKIKKRILNFLNKKVKKDDNDFKDLLEIKPEPVQEVLLDFELSNSTTKSEKKELSQYDKFIKQGKKSPEFFLFTSQFYDLNEEGIQLIEAEQRTVMKLMPVLSSSTKECLKIGVVYVKPDQFEQNDILSNSTEDTTELYNDFLLSLGELVDLQYHKKYDAKLKCRIFSNGTHSIFYSTSRMEIMFHVSTMIPNKDNDPQRIIKKRHIGNDNVQIIWCENLHGYDPLTITSHFNDAHIVIYPYSEKLYCVDVFQKNPTLNIYPLPHHSIVPSKSLGPLVRTTAIVSDRLVRSEQEDLPMIKYNKLYDNIICSNNDSDSC